MQTISLRVFAYELFVEAKTLVGGTFEMSRPIIRLITMTLQRAHEIGIDPVLTQAHLEAVQAVMRTLTVIKSGSHVSDQYSLEGTISGDWALILGEALRCTVLGEVPIRPGAMNRPNMQNIPRTKSVNFSMQSSAADVVRRLSPKENIEQTVEQIMRAAADGLSMPCLGCAIPAVARHAHDCARRQPEPPKAPT
jgi:hypothetical protein